MLTIIDPLLRGGMSGKLYKLAPCWGNVPKYGAVLMGLFEFEFQGGDNP
jgi:hypothetical protein